MTHSITSFAQHVTPEGVTLHAWICSCTRRGKWTTLAFAESAGAKHVSSPQALGMSRDDARERCEQLWGVLGRPFTRMRRRGVANRFEVGYFDQSGFVTVMGVGPSWEIAFENAQKENCK